MGVQDGVADWKCLNNLGGYAGRLFKYCRASGIFNYGNLRRDEDIKELKDGMIDRSQWRQVFDDRLAIEKVKGWSSFTIENEIFLNIQADNLLKMVPYLCFMVIWIGSIIFFFGIYSVNKYPLYKLL